MIPIPQSILDAGYPYLVRTHDKPMVAFRHISTANGMHRLQVPATRRIVEVTGELYYTKRHEPRLPTGKRCQNCVSWLNDCKWEVKDELCRYFKGR